MWFRIESQKYLTEPDRHNITSDTRAVSLVQTYTIILNQDQTTGLIPESYVNINSEGRVRERHKKQRKEGHEVTFRE